MKKMMAIGAALAFALSAGVATAQDDDDDKGGSAEPTWDSGALETHSNDLAIRAEDVGPLEVAGGDYGFAVEPKNMEFDIGTAYNLTILSPGMQECQWRAPEFFENIYIRKVEVGGVEVKARTFEELEFGDDGESEVEIFFVPIRPGTFEWQCRNLAQRDVVGTFVFK